jgi:hypothetical protein
MAQLTTKSSRSATPPPQAPERLVPPPAPHKPTEKFCPGTADNKHVWGEPRVVGYHSHGPVTGADCQFCVYTGALVASVDMKKTYTATELDLKHMPSSTPPPRKASDNFCPVAQDNKHTYGPARTVGNS